MYLQRINYTFFSTGMTDQKDMLIDALSLGNRGKALKRSITTIPMNPQQYLLLSPLQYLP